MNRTLLVVLFALISANSFAVYNPQQGRWLSRDPVGEKGGANRYAFCENNGIDRIDLYGLIWHYKMKTTALWRNRGETTIDEYDFTFNVLPSTSSGESGCCKLKIRYVTLLMTVTVPKNASQSTILHELDHVVDFVHILHDDGLKYLKGYEKNYKTCDAAKCIARALYKHAMPILVAKARIYTIEHVDYPDAGWRWWEKQQYEGQVAESKGNLQDEKPKLQRALDDCEQ